MRKQPIITVLVAVIVIALGVITFAVYKSAQNNESNNAQLNNTSAQEEALEKARAFEPPEGTMCTQVMTPAVHEETGATHTFTSGCLPDGWKRSDSPGDSPRASQNDNHENQTSSTPTDTNLEANRADVSARPPSSSQRSEVRASDPTGAREDISPEERALREARSYKPGPDTMCTQVLTPATHKATGIRYTFPTGCIPDGWVRDSDRTPRYPQ